MNRKSFLKSLLTISVAPKVLAEVDIPAPAPKTISLFNDLHAITPSWYAKMVEKYGNENYAMLLEQSVWMGGGGDHLEFNHYEKTKGIINQIV
jgi:hypothetical protein